MPGPGQIITPYAPELRIAGLQEAMGRQMVINDTLAQRILQLEEENEKMAMLLCLAIRHIAGGKDEAIEIPDELHKGLPERYSPGVAPPTEERRTWRLRVVDIPAPPEPPQVTT
jgi:hypothetical protein